MRYHGVKKKLGMRLLGIDRDVLMPDPPDYTQRAPRNVTTMPRHLTDEDVNAWHEAAEMRENPIWKEIDLFLNDLKSTRPIKAAQIRNDIKWLRRKAFDCDLDWGKE